MSARSDTGIGGGASLAGVPIVCFANDWRGDPTSKHHVMRILARSTDVLWVESSGMRVPRFWRWHDLKRIAERLRRGAQGPVGDPSGVVVSSPVGIPLPANRAARAVNGLLYRRTVRRALARHGWTEKPLLWVYTPTVSGYLRGMPRRGLVYHCVDRWWEFGEYDTRVMRDHHERLCRDADVVFASSKALLADCEPTARAAYLVPHGVEWEHFARAALDPPPRPADIADITGPVIGFFGLLHDWVDQRVIAAIAEAFPDATVVLIGKAVVDVGALERLPNVRLLGQRPYADLPAYCAAFDVGLVPFVFNELTAAVNPIKLREYLSAGIPTVASALPEIQLLGDHPRVRLAHTVGDFVEGVSGFLGNGRDAASRAAAARAMAQESWDGRCRMMADLVAGHVPGFARPA